MAIQPGYHLGPYETLAAIGAGGMGEVYRARDSKLGRDVAIKVLPEAFARDADRMARFQREAKFLASLNHPNIASIYGFEDSGSTRALVMELIEGPTLADRIKSGPIPIDEAMAIITAEGRKPLSLSTFPSPAEERAEAFSTLSAAYAGSYTVAGDKVIHHIEVAWVQNVVNTDQVRFVRLQGDRLTVRGGWVLDGVTYGGNSELVWDRVKSETSDK